MPQKLPDGAEVFFDEPYYATISTVEPDGQPQVTVVWTKRDGDDILISTVRGRRKERNLRARPQATVFVLDPENPWHYVEVRGTVTLEDDPEKKLIHELSHKYVGEPYRRDRPEDERVIIRVTPTKVNFNSGR